MGLFIETVAGHRQVTMWGLGPVVSFSILAVHSVARRLEVFDRMRMGLSMGIGYQMG